MRGIADGGIRASVTERAEIGPCIMSLSGRYGTRTQILGVQPERVSVNKCGQSVEVYCQVYHVGRLP